MVQQMSAEPGPQARRWLVTLHSPDASLRDRSLPLGEALRVGRVSADNIDLTIRDRLISARHATVERGDDGRYHLIDHNSRNGTFVDGERVTEARLRDGQLLRMGITIFELAEKAVSWDDDAEAGPMHTLVGASAAFRRIVEQIRQLAKTDSTVTLVGESGTGKKRLAKYLHDLTGQAGALVVMECGAPGRPLQAIDLLGSGSPTAAADDLADDLTDDGSETELTGYFARAQQGTLVVDHIDELAPKLQQLVLRLLREGTFTPLGADQPRMLNARVVVTSNTDIETAVEVGSLNADLAAALGDERVEVTSLRTRRSDILRLSRYFLRRTAPERRLDWSPGCLERLLLYDWPVNVRELRVVMTRMATLEQGVQTLRSAHLPREIRRQLRQRTDDALRNTIVTVHSVPSRAELSALLTQHAGDIGALAEHYAKDRRHVRRWLLRHDLPIEDTPITPNELRPLPPADD